MRPEDNACIHCQQMIDPCASDHHIIVAYDVLPARAGGAYHIKRLHDRCAQAFSDAEQSRSLALAS